MKLSVIRKICKYWRQFNINRYIIINSFFFVQVQRQMIRNNLNTYQFTRNQPTATPQNSRTIPSQRFRYMQAADSKVRRFYVPGIQKQNTLRQTNISKVSPRKNQPLFTKSTSSTHQQTHPKTSTDNLHALRLQSQILQLQKTLDQQQYQLQTLTQQASHFMKLCQQQKQILISLNIEGMKSQYQQQINQLLIERSKVQEIILQLQDDYAEVYSKQEYQLNIMRDKNAQLAKCIQEQLDRKKSILTLLAGKDKQLHNLEVDLRESQQRIDQLRNVQRKFTIAIRQLQMMSIKSNIKKQQINKTNQNKIDNHNKIDLGGLSGERICQSPTKNNGNIIKISSFQRDNSKRKNKYKYEYQIQE